MASAKGKVFVGMSGGVDSSVAAYLLKRQNYEVIGVHLRCWNENGCDDKETDDARMVAEKIGIPFYICNLEDEYRNKVFNYMIDGYKRGLTPNPDVMCNREIKFGAFLKKALELGADYIATGHYVRLKKESGEPHLYQGKDGNKDQSYFLWILKESQLRHCLFPIGDYTKSEVRGIARGAGLPTAEKKDSQGICLVGKIPFKEFMKKYIPPRRGNVLSTSGKIIGTHEGAYYFTIGQRHGLGISGDEPYYVAEKDTKTNTIVLAKQKDPALYRDKITLTNVNFVSPIRGIIRANYSSNKTGGLEVYVRIRYRQPLQKANLYKLSPRTYKLAFEKPQKSVAPGQSAVFYTSEGQMLGGGVIE